jgi:Pilus assembly protein, PilP
MKLILYRNKTILILLLLLISPCMAVRDIFELNQDIIVSHPLVTMNIKDLSFSGAIIATGMCCAFLEDSAENIYRVSLGQQIGVSKAKVIKILPDQILLLEGSHYMAIK